MLSYYQFNELTTTAIRPFKSNDGRYTCLFQGEITNLHHLRNKLEKTGIHPNTDRPEEVILELFLFSGDPFAQLLRGKFAIIIFDNLLQKITAVRDRYGSQLLHYKLVEEGIAFALKLTDFLALEGWALDDFNQTSLRHYFSYGYIPEDDTFLNEVYHIPAGCILKYDKSGLSVQPFADLLVLEGSAHQVLDEQEFYNVITESIQARLSKNESIGMFFRGKIADVALINTANLAGCEIILFQADFDQNKKSEHNFDSRIIKRKITPEDYWKSAIASTRILGLPLADSWLPVENLLAELAQKHTDILISTDGTDLLFGTEKPFLKKMRNKRIENEIFSEKEKQNLLQIEGESWEELIAYYLAEIPDLKPLFRIETLAFNTQLKAKVLKTEQIANYYDLVARFPFLDDNVVNMANFLTRSEKKSMNLFKKIFAAQNTNFGLPVKKNLNQIPLAKWIRTCLFENIKELFEEDVVTIFFDHTMLMKILMQHRRGFRDFSDQIWAVVVFIFWIKEVYAPVLNNDR